MSHSFADYRARAKNHWNHLTESQRDAWKFGTIALAVAMVGVAAWRWGGPWWKRWQRDQALEQARDFAVKNDYRSTALALRRALELSPHDPAAWRAAIAVLADIGSPDVLVARDQLARLSPEDVSLKLAVVAEALRLNRWDVAQSAWNEASGAAERDAAFFRLGASLALAMGRAEEVESNLEQLVRRAPDDIEARFNLAAVRLWSTDEQKRAAGRSELEELTRIEAVRVRAALELLKESARQRDGRRAREVMTLLGERFLPGERLDFSHAALPGWTRLVEAMKSTSVQNGGNDVAQVAQWLADIGRSREALVWIDTLETAVGESPAVAGVAAQLSAELGDLDRLERRLRAGAWGVWPRDVITLAMSSRLQRLRYSESNGRDTWNDAVTAARDSIPALRALVRLAAAWDDADGGERALQRVIEVNPKQFWAYGMLRDSYAARAELPKLWQLYDQWTRQLPADDEIAATWITLGAILNRLSPEAQEKAEAIYGAGETRTVVSVPLAAVRWRQNRPAEALEVLRSLPEPEQKRPQVALWLGLVHADLKNDEPARENLLRAWHKDLSRDEMSLVRAAAAKCALSLPVW